MQVKDVMSPDVKMATPETTLAEAARLMRDTGVGVLPVNDSERLVGMITDRDIVIRGLAAESPSLDMPIGEIMSDAVLYCYDDQQVEDVLRNMAECQVRRMPVVSRDKQLLGIVSLANLAQSGDAGSVEHAVKGITEKRA